MKKTRDKLYFNKQMGNFIAVPISRRRNESSTWILFYPEPEKQRKKKR